MANTLTFKQFLDKQTTKTISSLYSFITAQYEWGFEYHFKQLPDLSKKFAQYGIEWSVDGLKAISDFKKKIIANLMTARNKEHEKKEELRTLKYLAKNIREVKYFVLADSKIYPQIWTKSGSRWKLENTSGYTLFSNLRKAFNFKYESGNNSPRKGAEHEYYRFTDTKKKAEKIISVLENLQ